MCTLLRSPTACPDVVAKAAYFGILESLRRTADSRRWSRPRRRRAPCRGSGGGRLPVNGERLTHVFSRRGYLLFRWRSGLRKPNHGSASVAGPSDPVDAARLRTFDALDEAQRG